MRLKHTLLSLALGSSIFLHPLHAEQLPALGDSASSLVSLQQEYELGRRWLRQLRANTTPLDNPLMQEFVENLVYKMLPYADMPQRDFEFILIDKRELNAFAAPGGIIGVNFGIFLFAEDEDEIAAVLAHELAHLGQRHFARGVEQAEQQEPMAIATLLASILLIATNNAQAGFAGLYASQAAGIQSQLAYSRDWEREADRVGIRTLAEAGLSPQAMPAMFKQMLASQRIGEAPPEFLLTHPLTEARIADAAARAALYPIKAANSGLHFEILKQEARLRYRFGSRDARQLFEDQTNREDLTSNQRGAITYALALLDLQADNPQKTLDRLQTLPPYQQDDRAIVALKARALAANGNGDAGLALVKKNLPYAPGSYVLKKTLADLQSGVGQTSEAVATLRDLSTARPGAPEIWQQLAQAAGQANQPILAYQANAEYLYLTGDQAKASRQLDLAIQEAGRRGEFQRREALRERLRQIAASDRPDQ